jgi:type IV fimbrial biogenesis protein FimT
VYGAQSELLASMALAKTEAMRRGVPVVISATSPVSGNEFGGGWTVWADTNGNGTLEQGEPIVRTHEAMPSNVTITSGGAGSLRFGTMGFLVPAASFSASVCPVNAPAPGNGFVVSVAPNGMADVAPSPSC